jgi:hypothetical protein
MIKGLNNQEVDSKIEAFDEWLEMQNQLVQDKVRCHIEWLVEAIPHLGDKSAKVLLAGVYLRVREVTRLPAPKGAKPPILVIVEDV